MRPLTNSPLVQYHNNLLSIGTSSVIVGHYIPGLSRQRTHDLLAQPPIEAILGIFSNSSEDILVVQPNCAVLDQVFYNVLQFAM
jgi:hypothetical protein